MRIRSTQRVSLMLLLIFLLHRQGHAADEEIRGSEEDVLRELGGDLDESLNLNSKTNSENRDASAAQLQHPHEDVIHSRISSARGGHFCGTIQKQVSQISHTIRYTRLQRETYHGLCKDHATATLYNCVQWRVEPRIASRQVMKPVMGDVPVCCDGWTGEDCSVSIVKDGYCPSSSTLLEEACGLHCTADADCTGFSEKCCNTTCGRSCVRPAAEHARNLERAASPSPFSLTSPATQPALQTQIALSQMDRSPYYALCSVWGFDHLRAFNNRWVNFTGGCQYTLVKNDKVEIAYENTDTCLKLRTTTVCQKRLFLRLKEYQKIIDVSVFKSENQPIPTIHLKGKDQHIPAKIGHAFFEHVGGYVVIFGNNWKILFDYAQGSIHILFAKIDVNGICGDMASLPGYVANDKISEFEEKWRRPSSVNSAFCSRVETVSYKGEDPCLDPRLTPAQREVSRLRCSELNGTAFADCHTVNQTVLPLDKFIEACERDVCAGILDGLDSRRVPCSTATEYARECKMFSAAAVNSLSWRRSDFCGVQCGKDQVYRECDSTCPKSCASVNADPSNCNDHCIDGCVCKDSLYVNNTLCYQKDQCSCSYMGTLYNPNSVVKQRCSTCTCVGGNWNCLLKDCEGTCSITGNTRIISFDSRVYYYAFAECSYDVIRYTSSTSTDFNVEVSLGPCSSGTSSYCISKVTVYWGDTVSITLKDTSQKINENGKLTTTLPYTSPLPSKLVSVINASSHFRRIEISDQFSPDLVVEWNGAERLYILLDDSYKARSGDPQSQKVKGLCGNYDGNTGNDLGTQQTSEAFGDAQRTASSLTLSKCIPAVAPSSICGVSVENTKKTCSRLLQSAKIFGKCWNVVPLTGSAFGNLVTTCENDVCNCPDQVLAGVVPGQFCLCQSLATYAHLCALSGVRLDWRLHFPACRVSCPPNQRYKECGQPCPRVCPMMLTSREALCNRTECLEGCECEPGFLHDKTPHGECVAPDQCSCVDDGKAFRSRDIIVRNISGTTKQCECKAGQWDCVPYIPGLLSCGGGMVHRTCVSPCQPTCANPNPSHCRTTDCIDRCACPDGQLQVSEKNNTCVVRTQCPCTYGTKMFPPGFMYPLSCNNCTCEDGDWTCTNDTCRGFCAATGDPHYESFDGLRYSFQGQTKYVLAQYGAKLNATIGDLFRILVENIDCGEDGVTCTKSVEIHVLPLINSLVSSYTIKLDQELRVTVNGTLVKLPYDVCSARIMYNNLFVIVEDDALKFKVSWDGSMRVYVEVDPCYGGLMEGLCGNFDDDASNDLQARSGILEANVYAFGNSWKVDTNALDTPFQYNSTCDLKGGLRRLEAKAICEEALMSPAFAACRNVIDVAYYLERCIDSTCACDKPGDDRCKCTSIAHFAHMCGRKNICVLWRDQFGCPMQCTGKAEYEACTCPNRCPGTRDKCTRMEFHEGCTCPLGTVYNGSECNPCSTCYSQPLGIPVQVGFTSNGDECLSGHDDLTRECAARPEPRCGCLPDPCPEPTCPPCYDSVRLLNERDCCRFKCVQRNCPVCPQRHDPSSNLCTPKLTNSSFDGCCSTEDCSCPKPVQCCEYEKSVKTWNQDTCCYSYSCACDDTKCPSFKAKQQSHVNQSLYSHQSLNNVTCSAGQCSSNTPRYNTSCGSCCSATVNVYSCECNVNCNATCPPANCSMCEEAEVKQPSMTGQDCCPTYSCKCSSTKCDSQKAAFRLNNPGLIFDAAHNCPLSQCLNKTGTRDLCKGCCSISWYECISSDDHPSCASPSIAPCSCEVKGTQITYSNATCCPQYTCGCVNSSVCNNKKSTFILRHPANSTHMYNKSASCPQGRLVFSHLQAVSSDGCGKECCNVSVYRCECQSSTCSDQNATHVSINAQKCLLASGVHRINSTANGVYPDCCSTWTCGCNCSNCTSPPSCNECQDLSYVAGTCQSSNTSYVDNHGYGPCCAKEEKCHCNTTKCDSKIAAFKASLLTTTPDAFFDISTECPQGKCLNVTSEELCKDCCSFQWYECIPSVDHPNCSASALSCPCEVKAPVFTYNNQSCCKAYTCECVNSTTCEGLKATYEADNPLQTPEGYDKLASCPVQNGSDKAGILKLDRDEAVSASGCGKSCCSVDVYRCECNSSNCHDKALMDAKSQNCSRAGGVFRIDREANGAYPDCCNTWTCGCNCSICTPQESCNECETLLGSSPGKCGDSTSEYFDNHGYSACCPTNGTCKPICSNQPTSCPAGQTLIPGNKGNGCCNRCEIVCNKTTCDQCPSTPTTLYTKCENTTVTPGLCSTNATNSTSCCDTHITRDNEICSALNCSGQHQVTVPANYSAGSCCPTCKCDCAKCVIPTCGDCKEPAKVADGHCGDTSLPLGQCCPRYECRCSQPLCAAKKTTYLTQNPSHKFTEHECAQGECPEKRTVESCSDCCSFTPYECRLVKDMCDPAPPNMCPCKAHEQIPVFNSVTNSSAECCPNYTCGCVAESACDVLRQKYKTDNPSTIFDQNHVCPTGSSCVPSDPQPVLPCTDVNGKDCCTVPVFTCECNCSSCPVPPTCKDCDRTPVEKKNGTCGGGSADQCCTTYDCLCPLKTFPSCSDSDIVNKTCGCEDQVCKTENPVPKPDCCCGNVTVERAATGSPCGCFDKLQCITPPSTCPVDVSSSTDLKQYCPSDFEAVKDKVVSTTCDSIECSDCGHCKCNVSCLTTPQDLCGNCGGCITRIRKTGQFSKMVPLSSPVAAAPFNCCEVYKECDKTITCKKTCDLPCEEAVLVANATGDVDTCGCCPTYECRRKNCPDLGPLPDNTAPVPCVTFNMTIESNSSCDDSCCGCRTVVAVPCNCSETVVPDRCGAGSCAENLTTVTVCDGKTLLSTDTHNPSCNTTCANGLKADCGDNGCCRCPPPPTCNTISVFDVKSGKHVQLDCYTYLKNTTFIVLALEAEERGMLAQGTCKASDICDDCVCADLSCNATVRWVTDNTTTSCCNKKEICTEKECTVCPKMPCCPATPFSCPKCQELRNFTNDAGCLEYECVPRNCTPAPDCASPSCGLNMTISSQADCGCTVYTCKCPPTTTKAKCCPTGSYPKLFTPATTPENCTCPSPEYRCVPCVEDRAAFINAQKCENVTNMANLGAQCSSNSQCPKITCDKTKCSKKQCDLPLVQNVTQVASEKGCDCCDTYTCTCKYPCDIPDARVCSCNETAVTESDGCCSTIKCVERCSLEKCPSLSCVEVDRFFAHTGDCCMRCKEVKPTTCPPIPAACQVTNPYTTTFTVSP